MSLPKKLYRLVVVQGEGNSLGYRQRGGGTFSSLSTMNDRIRQLDSSGVKYEIHVTECNWEKVDG